MPKPKDTPIGVGRKLMSWSSVEVADQRLENLIDDLDPRDTQFALAADGPTQTLWQELLGTHADAEAALVAFRDQLSSSGDARWALKDELADCQAAHDYLWTDHAWEWDDLVYDFGDLIKVRDCKYGWLIEAHQVGWRSLDGYALHVVREYGEKDIGQEMLWKCLPKTDCSFVIYNWRRAQGFAINNAHHDAPSEWYYLRPIAGSVYDDLHDHGLSSGWAKRLGLAA